MGKASLALDLALETTAPSYGFQIANGATTLWENWSGSVWADPTQTLPPQYDSWARTGFTDSTLLAAQEVDAVALETGQGPSHNHHFLGGIGQWLQTDLVGLVQGPGVAFSHRESLHCPA
jgi:hypothetical protein